MTTNADVEAEAPRPVLVTRAQDVKEGGGGDTSGLIRQGSGEPEPQHFMLQGIAVPDDNTSAETDPSVVHRQAAIVNLSPSMCGILARAQPNSASAVHHHGPQDTIVYAVSGHGSLVSSSSPAPEHHGDTKVTLEPGDWALIPAYREHQEVNDGEELVWVIVRAPGGTPETVNLTGWNGEPVG